MRKYYILITLGWLAHSSYSQSAIRTISSSDSLAIINTSMDYIEGWYEASVNRMERCLHPDLVKRNVSVREKTKKSYLNHLSKSNMIEYTNSGGGSSLPKETLFYKVIILDIYDDIATVKGISAQYIDYLHLAKWNDKWMIINIIWDNRV